MPYSALDSISRTSTPRSWSSNGDQTIELSKLPPGAMFMRILGVNYVRLRTSDDGDLYVTEHGLPFWRQLQPENWYETDWFSRHKVRLQGTGTVYRIPTRPIEHPNAGPKSIEIVAKWSRVGEDVPLDTFTLQRAVTAEFNTPFEEFSLVEDLRRGEHGPRELRIHTQKPLAIFVPPDRMQLWQTGRSRDKILQKFARHPGVEIDILRSYIMLYGWIEGMNAVDALGAICPSLAQVEMQLREFTLAADAELRSKGFVVADHKPTHLIVRPRGGALRTRGPSRRTIYAIVDYELLNRTPEYDQTVMFAKRTEYFSRQRDRFLPRDAKKFPAPLRPVNVLGVPYVYGSTASTQGQLWVVGNDAELFSYFLPERWRQKQVAMSPRNQVYYVQSKDRIHLLWKVSNVGDLPALDTSHPRYDALIEQGFNSPFEEVAFALEMRRRGVPTIHPRAIYATSEHEGVPGCVADARRFERFGEVLRPDQDYITIWGFWRGLDDGEACNEIPRWSAIDAAQACRAGMITSLQEQDIVDRQRRLLAEAGFLDVNLRGEHILLSYVPGGSFKTDADGQFELRHANFEFIRPL